MKIKKFPAIFSPITALLMLFFIISAAGANNQAPSSLLSAQDLEYPKNSSSSFSEVTVYTDDEIITYTNQVTELRGEASSRENEIVKYEWDFDGDGVFDSTSSSPDAQYTYRVAGVYEAMLKATDAVGLSDFDIVRVTVERGNGTQHFIPKAKTFSVSSSVQSSSMDGITKRYVVMINGAVEDRFWNDVNLFYTTLTDVYGYTPEEIFVLNYNGNNPSGQNPNGMIDYAATKSNLNLVFSQLATIMDGDDILFVWITDHGRGYAGYDYYDQTYFGYLDGEASVDIGDEQDYIESEFKLRSFFMGGDYKGSHGLNVWAVRHQYVSSMGAYMFFRQKYVSTFPNITFENGSTSSDSDIFIERFEDYLLGDTNRNGYLETSLGEVADYDGDGIPPYNGATGEFDEDDWGQIDTYSDNSWAISSQVPGGSYCTFDYGLDGTLDIDLNCQCDRNNLDQCDTSLLHVDGTDIDNAGLFDGIDVNEDGDMDDWVSIDELVGLYGSTLSDDELRAYLDSLSFQNAVVFMEPCYSGGFVEDLSNANTVVMAASLEEDLSWGNYFVGLFRDALNTPALADISGDGKVSMVEAFNYASQNDPMIEVPQYDDNGDGISHTHIIPNGGDGVLGASIFIDKDPAPLLLPPTANAGSDQSVVDSDDNGSELVTLDGTLSSDPDGTIVSYEWSEGGSPLATGPTPQVTLSLGTHVVDLLVTDNDGLTDTDSVVVDVTAPVLVEITLFSDSFEASEWNGNWTEDNQNAWDRFSGVSTDGSYSARVRGTANNASLTTAQGVNTVGLTSPTLTFDWYIDSSLDSGEYVAADVFNGTSWTEVARLTPADPTGTWISEQFDLTSYSNNSLKVRFRGTMDRKNERGYVDNVYVTALSSGGPLLLPPTANAGSDQSVVDSDDNGSELVTLDGTLSSDPDGTIVSYEWSEGGSPLATGPTPQVTLSLGTHVVDLLVTDNDGLTDTDSVVVVVNPYVPPAAISLSANGYKVKGLQKADLAWSGATSQNVDVLRDGSTIATATNSGTYTDNIDQKGSGSYTYQVCEEGTSVCSSQVVVSF